MTNKELFHILEYNKKYHFWTILYWDLFRPSRSKKLLRYLNDGMSWEFAFKKAKIDELV